MRHAHKTQFSFKIAAFAVLVTSLFAATAAAEVTLTSSRNVHKITGGAGAKAWTLVYGSTADKPEPLLREVSPSRAYFALNTWIRLIDTENGIVIGRWMLPGKITDIKPVSGDTVDVVSLETQGSVFYHNTYRLDPAHPQLPVLIPDNLQHVRSPRSEPNPLIAGSFPFGIGIAAQLTNPADVEKAKAVLAATREQVRRDPLSPFFRLEEGHILRMLGDPAAAKAYESALDVPVTNWVEWFQLSTDLEREGQHDLFLRAFEQAYGEYWRDGNDPRLLKPLITRLILFTPWGREMPTGGRRLENIDKEYRFMPYGEGAPLAWEMLARELETTGPPDAAKLWRERADESRDAEASFGAFIPNLDVWLLALFAALTSGGLYAMVVNRRYTAQNHYDMAAGKRQWTFFNLQNIVYWSRRERLAFIFVFVFVWVACGCTGTYLGAELRIASQPLSVFSGAFRGSITEWHFNRLPASPERDLLTAQLSLQSGRLKQAEALYRNLPQFAEAWNNLGVIQQQSGNPADAKASYERALQIDPRLHEAELNLGRAAKDLWTQMHKQYAPDAPMLAPPSSQRIRAAYLGGSRLRVWPPALLKGPFALINVRPILDIFGFSDKSTGPAWLAVAVGLLVLIYLSVAVLLLILPYREVTQPPARGQTILEIIFPGTAPAWNILGGLVLGTALALVIETLLCLKLGTPWIMSSVAMPNLIRAYLMGSGIGKVFDIINPGRFWLYGAAPLLWVINAVVVLISRRGTSVKPAASSAASGS